jgi:hypothetical protein
MKNQSALKDIFQASLILTFLIVSRLDINAQTTDSLRNKIEDGWIEIMTNKLSMDVSLNNSYETFEVKTPSSKFILYPNTPNNLRLKLNYRFISFGFQFAPNFIPGNGDEDLKGKTKSFGLGIGLIFKHWFLDLAYSKVKGYYLENSDDFVSRSAGDPYIQFPDLHYNGFAISSGYFNNSRFSFRSLSSQTERQLKSAGTFLPAINFRYYIIDDKSSGASSQKSNNYEGSIGPGYTHTFVVKENFYLSLGLQASLGYLNTKLTTRFPDQDVITKQDNFIFRWDGKTGLGYNGSNFYTGVYANISGTRYNQENTTAINFETRVFYHFFIGFRIKSPRFIRQQVDFMESKIPKK